MTVNNVNGNNTADAMYSLIQQKSAGSSAAASNAASANAAGANSAAQNTEDTVELSGLKPKEQVSALKADLNKNTDTLRQMVQALLEKQGGIAQGAGSDFLVQIDQETREWAQAQIAEDGYWGVDKTAERILNFAKAISGGDTGEAEKLRNAIMKGFEQAEKAWGGKLPDISKQTIDKVMAGLDEWAGITKTE